MIIFLITLPSYEIRSLLKEIFIFLRNCNRVSDHKQSQEVFVMQPSIFVNGILSYRIFLEADGEYVPKKSTYYRETRVEPNNETNRHLVNADLSRFAVHPDFDYEKILEEETDGEELMENENVKDVEYSGALDVDTFVVRISHKHLANVTTAFCLRPYFRTVGHKLFDQTTLQIGADPYIISVPLTATIKEDIIKLLLKKGTCIVGNEKPNILASHYHTLMTKEFIDILSNLKVDSVFVANYGLKMGYELFTELFPKHMVMEWDQVFLQNYFENLPETVTGYTLSTFENLGKNYYQVGRSVRYIGSEILMLLPIGAQRRSHYRAPYHLLGSLGDVVDSEGGVHQFGTVTFTKAPEVRRMQVESQESAKPLISKRVFYMVRQHVLRKFCENNVIVA
jgi:hypothetical protein